MHVFSCMKKFKVLLYEGEDGYYVTECPELPGCVSQGKTKTEALKNMKEARELYLEVSASTARTVNFVDISVTA